MRNTHHLRRVLTDPLLLRVEIPRHRASQLSSALACHTDQILQIIARRNAELAHKILRGALQIAVLLPGHVVLRPAEVRVAADGLRALEALQPGLRFGLRVGIEGAFAKELVAADAFLVAEFLARVLFAVVFWGVVVSVLLFSCRRDDTESRR